MERKPRLPREAYMDDEGDGDDYDYEEPPESDEDKKEIDDGNPLAYKLELQRHLADLLPGELVDGKKPIKAANTLHLEDLRKIPKQSSFFRDFFMYIYRLIKRRRAAERERRKHHLIADFEEKVRRYDKEQKELLEKELEKMKNDVLLEAHRRLKRIEKNSVKKTNEKKLIEDFTQDLNRRDEEMRMVNYYTETLQQWSIEGMFRRDRERVEEEREAERRRKEEENNREIIRRKALIKNDAHVLLEDQQMTREIQGIMVRSGFAAYEKAPAVTEEEKIDKIFEAARSQKLRQIEQERLDKEREQQIQDGILVLNTAFLQLTMRDDFDYQQVHHDLAKPAFKKKKRISQPVWPFHQDMASTGDVLTLKGVSLGEVGALTLAGEFTRGGCPMLEELIIKDCRVKNEGIGRLLQGIKMANLLNIRVLNLRGNTLGPRSIEYLRDSCKVGVLANLKVLILSDNELGDAGLSNLCTIISDGLLKNIHEIHLQNNSITDKGFMKIMKLMKSVQETRCPLIQRLGLEKNVVSVEAKRKYSPYPFYMSV